MTKQEIFTSASRKYLEIEENIRRLCLQVNDSNIDLDQVLKSYDLMVQVLFLYMTASDNKVSDLELEFIKKLTIEQDVLDTIYKKTGRRYYWENLKSESMDIREFNDFIDFTYNAVFSDISSFIMLVASLDAKTNNDYYHIFENDFKALLDLFIETDGVEMCEKIALNVILDRVFLLKYRSLKTIFTLKIELC